MFNCIWRPVNKNRDTAIFEQNVILFGPTMTCCTVTIEYIEIWFGPYQTVFGYRQTDSASANTTVRFDARIVVVVVVVVVVAVVVVASAAASYAIVSVAITYDPDS